MATTLPDYIRASVPNPSANRGPWYKNTAPSYAGVFLWVAFYLGLAGPTISQASLGVALLGLVVAGLLCFGLYYYVPAMLGMQTGRPLYVVGASTFGTAGGYVMPGLLMGLLQLGWFAVATYFATDYIMQGLHQQSKTLFIIIALLWAYILAWIAIKGIAYVARVAQVLNWVPLIMILIVFWANKDGISNYQPPKDDPLNGFLAMLGIVIGFFATAGAAGADFGMNNRNRKDIVWGGLVGIALAIVVAGGLPLLSVAGFIGKTGTPNFDYAAAIASVGALAPIIFFLFAAASLAPTCFCTFIASNSFGTMLPKVPKTVSTLVGVTIGALLAITGVAQHLIVFFQIVGASFGPICGAMAADYILAGNKWSGPRLGINWAGYIAWAVGFLVGILDKIPGVPEGLVKADRPAVLWSFIVGFIVYYALSLAGLRPPVVAEAELSRQAA
ncbi:MAG: cytosine permease [Acidobacteria bacterium]|nr:MAG: cytosine permease [Acidobacteriota bacterium]PYV06434.1 MAG: cytosine permease [Acidobacteriota bacterium]PYV26538.1 MAG: cytosine permease [Acidobacteriota bacterium]